MSIGLKDNGLLTADKSSMMVITSLLDTQASMLPHVLVTWLDFIQAHSLHNGFTDQFK